MRRASVRLLRGASFLVFALAPLINHSALVTDRWGTVGVGIIALQTFAIVSLLPLRLAVGPQYLMAGLAGLAVGTALWYFAGDGFIASSAVPHAVTYLALLALFGGSLLPGREPIMTIIARAVRGQLPPKTLAYTRHVTWAWCLFCVAQLAVSLALLLFAPLAVWSLFVNVLNLPLVLLLFTAEYLYRMWRYGHQPRDRFTDLFRLYAHIKGASSGHAE
jgi:uncharacterized membrane protein